MDAIELTRTLVGIESTTGHEGPVGERLAAILEGLGWRVTRQEVTDGRFNVYATRETPLVVFSTHLDTVPPFVPLREDDTHLHGRGTCDAKGIAAAMVAAAERLAAQSERRIGLLFVVGEENGSDGAKAATALLPKGRYLINGEPTENRLTTGQKGALRVNLSATGRAAHSGYPHEGVSALDPLIETLERLRRLPLPIDPVLGPATMNIGLVRGGVAPNVIPPSAEAQLLIRTVGPTDGLRQAIAAAAAPGVHVRFPLDIPAVRSEAPAGWDASVVSFTSDLPLLTSWGTGFQLGPGTIRVAHTDEERLAKRDLLQGVDLYTRLATDLLTEAA